MKINKSKRIKKDKSIIESSAAPTTLINPTPEDAKTYKFDRSARFDTAKGAIEWLKAITELDDGNDGDAN